MSSDRRDGTLGGWLHRQSPDVTTAVLEYVRYLWEPLVYSSAYIAIIAALEVVMVLFVLDLPANPTPLIVGCVTFTIYANDRLVDVETDAAANPGRTSFVRQHSRTLSGAAAVAYGLALMLAVYGGPGPLALTLFPAVAWVLYAVDWAPANAIPFQRLKELLVVNSLLVAVAWASTVVFLPVVYAGATITPAVLLLFGYFAVGTFIGAEIANLGDVAVDREENVATLPSTVGVRATKYALSLVGLAGLAVVGAGLAGGHFGVHAAVALVAGLVCMLGVVALIGRVDDTELLSLAGECARLPVLAILLASVTVI